MPVPSIKSSRVLNETEGLLNKLFEEVKMPESHGLGHCKTVLSHMFSALKSEDESCKALTETRKLNLCLAALLHEADDHKYFKEGSNNAVKILTEVLKDDPNSRETIDEVSEMISYVSASVNGNSVPEKAKKDPSLLWPRFCDRLESIGVIGAVRCYQYNSEKGDPLFTEKTPRPQTREEVWSYVTDDRWKQYQNGGNSASMMDHYYDKLLQIAVFQPDVVQNSYLVQEASKRVDPLVNVCLEYGKTGSVPEKLILSYIK